jgi:drug/metabolite transporter (DMT)-like permease
LSAPTGAPAADAEVLRGILYMCLACSLFPMLNACAKLLGAGYPITEVVWARYAGHLLVIMAMFMPRRGWRLFVARRPGMQVFRSVLLFASTAFYFSALQFLPLATAASISFTSPFIVLALSVPMLGERVGPHRIGAVLLGFAGALIIIRPGVDDTSWAALLVVCSASSFALYSVLTRKMAGVDSAETMITYAALVGVAVATLGLPLLPWVWPQGWLDLALFIGIGMFGGIGHLFVIKAFQHAQASVISPFNYVQLAGSTVLGYLLFGDFPDAWTWTGAGIIVGSGIYMAYREGLRQPRLDRPAREEEGEV